MTKTGYIGYLEKGSEIKCEKGGKKIGIVIENIVVDPDSRGILIYFRHRLDNAAEKTVCVGLDELHNWFNETKWTAIKTRR